MLLPKGFFKTAVILITLASASFANSQESKPSQISFTLNGKPFEPYYYLPLKSMKMDYEGALMGYERLVLLLDPADSYDFVGNLDKKGRLYLVEDNEKRLVGLKNHRSYNGRKPKVIDPFKGLSAEDMEHIRGICLDYAPSANAIKLMRHADPNLLMYCITNYAAVGEEKGLPQIPNTARFLTVNESSSDGFKDYSYLKSLESLAYLRLDTLIGPKIDLENISNNSGLIYLDLSSNDLSNVSALSRLKALRFLNLSWCEDLTETDYLSDLNELRHLEISRTRIKSLRSIEGLRHIEMVNANTTRLKSLPQSPVPSLKSLKAISTKLSSKQVASFRENNPQCLISHDWNETLQSALVGADRIRIRSGGTCHRRPEMEQTLYETNDKKEIGELIANIEMDQSDSGFHCMCCGNPTFEFYSGEKLAVTLGFHHGKSLRWMRGDWPGDAELSKESGKHLAHWLAANGVDGPLNELLKR